MADTNERKHDRIVIAETLEAIVALQFDTNARYLRTLADAAAELRKADAELTATPPADAALADLIAHMEHGAKLVDAIGALCCDGSPELNAADAIRKAAAALRARAVPEGKKYHDVAQRLYALLDDIDTAGDIAKSDDKLYRGIVERTQAKKRDFVVSCDGYTVTLADDSMLAASKEAP